MRTDTGSAPKCVRWATSQAPVTCLTRRPKVGRKGRMTRHVVRQWDKSDKLPKVTFGRVEMTVQRSRITFVDTHSSEELP